MQNGDSSASSIFLDQQNPATAKVTGLEWPIWQNSVSQQPCNTDQEAHGEKDGNKRCACAESVLNIFMAFSTVSGVGMPRGWITLLLIKFFGVGGWAIKLPNL